MKNLVLLLIVNISLVYGQNTLKPVESQEALLVSDIMTTHLIFKEKLNYLDIGSPFFVADTMESIVKIKHTGQGLEISNKSKKSNLTVITKSGTYYSIPLYYAPNVPHTTYHIDEVPNNFFSKEKESKKDRKKIIEQGRLCDELDYAQSNISLKNERDLMRIKISGLYYKDDYIGIRLELRNNATIDFDIDKILLRFKLKKKISPDYIYQERILEPVNVCNETSVIRSGKNEKIIMLFEKFTPNDNETLYIDVYEKNGGRSTSISIPRKKLLTPQTVALRKVK